MKYVVDDSTTFWAIGHESGVVAKQAEHCGKEVEMVVPFEEVDLGEVQVSSCYLLALICNFLHFLHHIAIHILYPAHFLLVYMYIKFSNAMLILNVLKIKIQACANNWSLWYYHTNTRYWLAWL